MKTRQILLDAAKNLLEKHKFDDITVQDIIDEAGVARTTFYRYFDDKYDIVSTYYKEYITMEMLCEYNGENFDEICLKIYDFMEKNKKFFKNILKNNREDFFSDFLYKYVLDAYYQNYKNFVKITTITDEAKFKMAAMANLTVFWFKKWIEEDCSIPAETMIQWGKDIIIDIYSICKTEQKQ